MLIYAMSKPVLYFNKFHLGSSMILYIEIKNQLGFLKTKIPADKSKHILYKLLML